MKRFRNFLALVAAAVLAAFAWTAHTIGEAANAVVATVRQVVNHGLSLFATEPSNVVIERQPAQYREYRQRQERRDRPVITATWRMCPSR